MVEKLRRIARSIVERKPEQWKQYGLQPLDVSHSPESSFAGDFAESLQQNLDFVIESQGADGGWEPSWAWGNQWEEAWEQSKREVTGVLTLENLRRLRAFGRIE